MRRIIAFWFLLACASVNAGPRVGAGLGYVLLQGDLHDYFANDFGYTASLYLPQGENQFGEWGWHGDLHLGRFASDDFNRSSKLWLSSVTAGVEQSVLTRFSCTLALSATLELSYFSLKNDLSDSYVSRDHGFFIGTQWGWHLHIGFAETWRAQIFAAVHTPELVWTNRYWQIGIGFDHTI